MSAQWNWPGSRWWRFDLHTHSPASYDFKPDAARTAKDWSAWVATAKSAGLQAVALTDHNTPEGISYIQGPAQTAGLVVFPGVEVTVGGIHLLCMFDPKATRDDVVSLLAKLGVDPPNFGLPTTSATKGIVEAIDIAIGAGAVVVAAHVNGPRGLVMLEGGDRLKALQSPGLAAAELCAVPSNPDDPTQWADPTSPQVQAWLEGTNTAGRRLVSVWSSDSHGAAQVGRQFTWLKMTRPDLEGLRLALLDGDGSVKPKDTIDDPNVHADHVVESIRITKAKYMGRPDALTLRFNPWLNAIIGGRGTGKSTVVDLIRKTLGREDQLSGGSETSLRAAFDKRMRVPSARTDEGLLTAETGVEIVYRKDGERFLVSWNETGGSRIARLEGDTRTEEQGAVRERFPIRIYSQKQLFDLAREPNALFNVIDDSDDVRGVELARLRREAETKYLSLRAEARALRAQAAELSARTAALADVRRKLEVLQTGESAKTLGEYRLSRSRDAKWTLAQTGVTEGIAAVEKAAEGLALVDLEKETDEIGDHADILARAYAELNAVTRGFKEAIAAAVGVARDQLSAVKNGADASTWAAVVAASDEAYKLVTEQLGAAGITNPDEYGSLLQRAADLETEITKLEKSSSAADEHDVAATEELVRYREARGELTTRRASFAAKTSGDLIRVEIVGSAIRDRLEDFVRDALGVLRFDEDYRALQDAVAPGVGQAWTYDKLDALVGQLRDVISDPQKPWPTKDRRFETALRKVQPERVDRLALYLPEDSVEVSFRDPRDKSESWKKLAQGSPGQQTAALLAFVLGYGGEPIVLDQPEDDLDNTLIYELLVRRLRETKPTRQVIVVTHNPNIVVHGDAELVVSLEARSGRSQVAFEGGLQEQKARDEICRVMEGGRDAFETRYRRIMSPR